VTLVGAAAVRVIEPPGDGICTVRPPHSSAQAPVVHIIGDFFAYVCQFEKLLFCQGIFLLFRQVQVSGSLFSQIVRVLVHRCSSVCVVRELMARRLWRVFKREKSNMLACEAYFNSGLCVGALQTKFEFCNFVDFVAALCGLRSRPAVSASWLPVESGCGLTGYIT